MPTIYLAGKISKHDWRHDVVEGLRSAYTDDDLGCAFVRDRSRQRDLEADGWRILRFAGKEVTDDTKRCVVQAAEFVKNTAPRPVRPALGALRRLGKNPC